MVDVQHSHSINDTPNACTASNHFASRFHVRKATNLGSIALSVNRLDHSLDEVIILNAATETERDEGAIASIVCGT